ncbi:ANKRD50 [Symbiodinium natans]|uniref:ANKRD50 protein n=1 Tax=Symbiodinium natans TaxID=878477 RepID=A0A812JT75_9DINO|nr:ANKRD50 [Symbiodinium natans]
MGSGSSVPKKLELEEEVADTGEDEPVDVAAEMVWEDEDAEYPQFPNKLFKGFLRGTVSRGKMKKVLVHYAKLQKEYDSENNVIEWRQALPEVKQIVRPSQPMDYTRASSILKDSFGMDHPKEILKCALSVGGEGLVYAVLRSLPAGSFEKLDWDRFFVENAMPFFGEDYDAAWKLALADELLPKCKDSLLQAMEEKDENGNPQILFEYAESGYLLATAKLLEVAEGKKELYKGFLTDAEVEKIMSFAKVSVDRMGLLALHRELVEAICKGDAAGVQAVLDKKADPNFDHLDGDSCTASPLVLATRQPWESRWGRCIFPFQRDYGLDPEVNTDKTKTLEVLKVLMSAPGIDVNVGAYSYGWHGSHVRMTPLGMAIIGEIDTGCSQHTASADAHLPLPRQELLKLLVKDPRTDLEESYFEFFEGGSQVGCGALMLLELRMTEASEVEIDYQAAMVLMQAGALMTKDWVQKLEGLDAHTAKVKEAIAEREAEEENDRKKAKEEAAAEAEDAEAAEPEEEAAAARPAEEDEDENEREYEKKEDGSIVWCLV